MNILSAMFRRNRTLLTLPLIMLVVTGGFLVFATAFISDPASAQTTSVCNSFPDNLTSCENGVKAGYAGTPQAEACPVIQVPTGGSTSGGNDGTYGACSAGWSNGDAQRKKLNENKNDSANWCKSRFPNNILACQNGYNAGYAGTSQAKACPTTGAGKLTTGESGTLAPCRAGHSEGTKRREAAGLNAPKAPTSDLERLAIKACKDDYGETGHAAGVCQRAYLRTYQVNPPADAAAACSQATNDEDKKACEKGFALGSKEKNGGATPAADNTGVEATDDCDAKFYNPLTWVICPIVDGINTAVDKLDEGINDLLTVNTASIFCTQARAGACSNTDTKSGTAYYKAWDSFRKIGLGIIFIVALVIIIASAFGYEILDAYTIRKTLPRVLLAIVFITLSWSILEFLINFTNDVGNGMRWLIYAPFDGMQDSKLGGTGQGISFLLLSTGVTALGIMGLLSFAVTALLAVLIAFAVLILRELIIVLLVIIAPIGIAMLILPNTRKFWQLWQNTLTTMLIAFPLITAIIATGRVFSNTIYAGNPGNGLTQIIAFLAYLLPYFMLPFAFRLAGGVLATLAGLANDRSKGGFDRLKNYRGQKVEKNMQGLKDGNRIRASNPLARGFNRTTRGIANAPSAGLNPLRMRSRYQTGMSQHHKTAMAEYMEKSEAWKVIQGNDDYLQATMKNMGGGDTEDDWRRYLSSSSGGGYTGQALEQGVAAIRAAKRDTNDHVFKTAAVVANASTGTGWKTGGAGQMMESINEAAGGDRDLAAGMLAEMRGRAERSRRSDLHGAGFGGQMADLNAMYSADYSKSGTKMTTAEATERNNDKALFLQSPGALIGARGDTVKLLAPQMVRSLKAKHAAVAAATTAPEKAKAQRALKQEYAMLAGRYDAMAQSSPENAQIMADKVLSMGVGGTSVQQTIEGLRGDSTFLQMRREYASAASAAAAGAAPGAGAPPPPTPGGPGGS